MKRLIYLISALFFLVIGVSHAWALPNCVGSWNSITWDNCVGTYVWENGNKYIGDWKNGKKHVQGTFTWANGDKYVGGYKDDKAHGQGTFTYGPNSEWAGDKYVGEFKDGKFYGQGDYTFANGEKYVGEFKDDKMHGQGTYTYEQNSEWAGNKYVGEFKDDKIHGQGTFIFKDGSKWVGAWKNNNLNGYAITYYADGSINQEGIFKDNEFLGSQKKN